MRSLRATASFLERTDLSGGLGAVANTGIDERQDFFRHQDHRLASEVAILPVLSGIEQRAERSSFLLKSQQLICYAVRRAMNDQLVADRLERYLFVRLIAAGLEQLDAAAALQLGEQRAVVINVRPVWIRGIGLCGCSVLGDEHAL